MSDSLTTAAGMVIDANGNVTYDFAGHIAAEGIDLPAGTGPPSLVQWGQAIAYAFGFEPASGVSELDLSANRGNVSAMLALVARAVGVTTATVHINNRAKLLLDSTGKSGFAQYNNNGALQIGWDGTNLLFFVDGTLEKTL